MNATQDRPATICWYCSHIMGKQVPVRDGTVILQNTIAPSCGELWRSLNPDSKIRERFTLCTVCALMSHLKYFAGLSDPDTGVYPAHFRMTWAGPPSIFPHPDELFQARKEARDREFRRNQGEEFNGKR